MEPVGGLEPPPWPSPRGEETGSGLSGLSIKAEDF
ncbi:hypothetical protein ABIB57_002564 [Devosia sp. UYZn731]